MNKIKWQLFYRKCFITSNENFLHELNFSDFPGILKLRQLTTVEIMILTVLVLQAFDLKNKSACISSKILTEYFTETNVSDNQLYDALYRLNLLDLISINIHQDIRQKTSSIAYAVNEESLIEKGIFIPQTEMNIWNLPNLNKG